MTERTRIAWGGKTLYGASVGILMLETRFPRIPGDMGNAETWPFPVLYKVVPGALPRRVVCERAEGLLDDFLAAAAELVRLGADGITTTCGFLSLYQREIAAHVGVPVATSSLMQIPFIERVLPPGKRVGVITISAVSLTEEHLVAAGADPKTAVVGTDNGREFSRVIINDEERLDAAAAALLAAANSDYSTGRLIAGFVREQGGAPVASVVGHGFKTSEVMAALANGTMGYACDVEPHHPEGILHPVAVMVPTALAVGE